MGKGSKTRPRAVSADEYDRRWESTFGRKKLMTRDEQEKKLKELDDEERARRESRGW